MHETIVHPQQIYAYTLYVRYVSTFYAVVFFFIGICRDIKQTYICVGDICVYLLVCIVVCSWVILLTNHGFYHKHKQSNICLFHHLQHHTKTLMVEHMFIRPHHLMKFIYLRCTVVFTYGVYKYTTWI